MKLSQQPEKPSSRAALRGQLVGRLQAAGLSRWQIALLATALLAVLYGVLWSSVGSSHAAEQAQTATEEQPPVAADDGADVAQPDAALGSDFLSEFDRLAGEAAPSEGTAVAVPEDSGTSSLATTLGFSLLVVLGLAYAGIWAYKQFAGRRLGAASGSGGLMAVQESRALGANQVLHLVRLGDELLLLGATDHNISCLARYGSDGLVPESFAEHLNAQMRPAAVAGGGPPPTTLQQSLRDLRSSQPGRGSYGD